MCTLQKFPFVDVERISTKGKKFAVIVDEAHSSQTGQTSERLKEVLADISTRGDEAIEISPSIDAVSPLPRQGNQVKQ